MAIESSHFNAVIRSHITGVQTPGCRRGPFLLALPELSGRTAMPRLRYAMPRLRYIEESEKTPHIRDLIESAKRTVHEAAE